LVISMLPYSSTVVHSRHAQPAILTATTRRGVR
jgi:hypothetical protein